MDKKYQVKIKLIENKSSVRNEYKKIADTGNERDNGAVYGYVPLETMQETETEILAIELETLDLKRIVLALIG